jgi:hypothetical protein
VKAKIISILKTIGVVAGAITGVAAVLGILWGVFSSHEAQKSTNQLTIETARTVDSVYHEVKALRSDVEVLKKVVTDQGDAIVTTQEGFKKSLLLNTNISKQQYYELTQGIDGIRSELKKNPGLESSNIFPIQLEPKEYWTPLILTLK